MKPVAVCVAGIRLNLHAWDAARSSAAWGAASLRLWWQPRAASKLMALEWEDVLSCWSGAVLYQARLVHKIDAECSLTLSLTLCYVLRAFFSI
jgi:hypothetical protein